MFPYLWLWCPQIHFPLSGAVHQDISPDWFETNINPDAGDADIERRVCQTVSYGRQIGTLTDVLISLVKAQESQIRLDPSGKEALDQLEKIKKAVDSLKDLAGQARSHEPPG